MSKTKVNGVHTVDFTNQSSIMETRGSVISGHSVVYSVDVRKGPCCCGQVTKKQILKGVDCIFKPGMNAILGPTGSGKSSLLDVLAGRKDPSGLEGEILFDGVPPPENFKCMVGYVVQDDVVMGTLTVRENFQFSAALRLPSNLTKADRDERVNTVVQELGLTHCADTKVGNEFIRGVSGGERKRTNIGMELIISPPVLFLDEPTTGLDANTANSVMLLLRRLALKGRTIIFSIHQPRYSIYRLFDTLMMLSLGEVVYHGPTKDSLDFFQSIGYTIQEHNNPPDFFLDVISGDFSIDVDTLDPEKTTTDEEDVHGMLVQKFRESNVNAKVQSEVMAIYDEYQSKLARKELVQLPPVQYNTSFFTQLLICSGRTIKNIARNPQTSVMQLFVILIFAAIVGGIYWQIENDCKSGIQNRVGAFFFIVMNQVFGNLSAVELFIKERAIFMHENVGGFYRVSAYFFSKIFCDVIPMRLFPVVIFSAVTYFMIGFTAEVDKFFIYTLSLFAVAMAASGLAFFFSALVKIFAIANLCIALCYVFMMVFSGLLINIASIAEWLRWIKWLSIFRYGLNALNINELKDKHFDNSTVCGNEYLSEQGIEYQTDFDLWQNIMALLVFSAFFLILTYVRLATMNKLK
ncbi:broad substrate specificity ATP-binding cassette transporter ABCG2-like [Saccostrea echinata]|uniref:broad substrate specificity ATP-binding cassette transporter ABCG2-like n=1 Tax=Saccostrea echinata TaxID=191078 RepID=UPI002A832448|nr:broad substrate specificity ATP-binding cassette transporter ABCG2-like [Saccostrea echinata]